MSNASRRGRSSRQKGQRGEREWRDQWRAHGYEAERGQQRSGGSDSPDVKHSHPLFHDEVKRTEALSLYKAMEQAIGDAGEGKVPIVAHKRNRKEWLVVMRGDDFFRIIKHMDKLEGLVGEE